MRTGGRASHPIDGVRVVTFGDDCPGTCDGGIAVHEARIAMIDEGGDIILPQFYAICCACHQEQYITKHGVENVQPCGCEEVPLAAIARQQKRTLAARAAVVEAELAEFRKELAAEIAQRAKDGTIPPPNIMGDTVVLTEEQAAKMAAAMEADLAQQLTAAKAGSLAEVV